MKLLKTLMLSLWLLPAVALAGEFEEGRHFEVVSQGPGTAKPEIVEYFSFACPHCRSFEPMVKNMLRHKPADIAFRYNHVDFLARSISEDLSRAWAVAELLQVEDQVKPAIYRAVQDQRSIKNAADIRAVFIQSGVNAGDYDNAIQSFMIHGRVSQMQKNTRQFGIQGVPGFVVNGKYRVITQSLTSAEELNELLFYLARL